MCFWAGAVTLLTISKDRNRITDHPTNPQTDRVNYRATCTRLKKTPSHTWTGGQIWRTIRGENHCPPLGAVPEPLSIFEVRGRHHKSDSRGLLLQVSSYYEIRPHQISPTLPLQPNKKKTKWIFEPTKTFFFKFPFAGLFEDCKFLRKERDSCPTA